MTAKDIMKKQVICVREMDTVEEVIKVILQNNVSGVPVITEDREVVGIVTQKDLMTCERGLNISSYIYFVGSILSIDGVDKSDDEFKKIVERVAKDIMSSPVYSVNEDATLNEIASVMVNRHINRVPVVDKNHKLVGIVSRGDLLPMLI